MVQIATNTLSKLFVTIGAKTSGFEKSMNNIQNKMQKTGEKMKNIGSSLTTKVTAPIAAGFTALTVGTRDFRETLAPLETNAKMAGVGMDQMSKAMSQMQGVTGETDANVEGLNNLLASGFKDENLSKVLDSLSGAAIKFKDTMKFEGVADGLQETLATGKAIGPFAELLERSGVELDGFNEGLEEAIKNGNEQNYILKTLSKTGLSEVYESYKKNNKELINSKEATYKLQEQLAKLGEKLEPIMTKFILFATKLVEWFNKLSPATQTFVGIVAALAAAAGPVLMIVGQLITAFSSIAPLLGTVGTIISGVAAGPLIAIAAAVAGVILIWSQWDEIVKFVKWFAGKIFEFVSPLAENIVKVFDWMKRNTVGVFQNMWNGIKKIINLVISGVNKMIAGLNKISIDIPDWVPELGGKKFGINISKISKLSTDSSNLDNQPKTINMTVNQEIKDKQTAEYANQDLLEKLQRRGVGGAYR